MNEIWKRISGFEHYEVSNLGAVRSLNRVEVRSHKGVECVRRLEGKMISQSANSNGYMKVVLKVGGNSFGMLVHRIVAAVFIKPPYDKYMIRHKDGDRSNNAVSNLKCKSVAQIRYCRRGCGNVLSKGKRVCDKCVERELTDTKPKSSARDKFRAMEYLKSIGKGKSG